MGDGLVAISGYDAAWAARADDVIRVLQRTLGPEARRIEHIGSTAIPGMAAKDLLDLQVSVTDLDRAAAEFDAPLRGLGFEQMPYGYDHVPAGRDEDQEVWVKRFWCRRGTSEPDVNLHVRLVGSPNERLALLFRDWMRAHPEAIPPYAAIKRTLAAAVPDSRVYTEVKDPIVDLVIVVAEEWAAATGWSVDRT